MLPDIEYLFRISGNQLFGMGSIISLIGITYLIRRYLTNTHETTNQYYTQPNENDAHIAIPGNTHNQSQKMIYIFWNGSMGSTYLLADFLQQDYIIQPLYIERYTIRKECDKTYLADINIRNQNGKLSRQDREYLKSLAKMKHEQKNELSQIQAQRRMIIKQYPEFRANFLPTFYITTIQKDLELSNGFFMILKELNPMGFEGIEILEQITRFWKYYTPKIEGSRVVIGYIKSGLNSGLAGRMISEMRMKHILDKIEFEIPLENVDSNELKYKAADVINFWML